jgi:hypothetical protein
MLFPVCDSSTAVIHPPRDMAHGVPCAKGCSIEIIECFALLLTSLSVYDRTSPYSY